MSVNQAIELASVCARLRRHATRAMHEGGYKAELSRRKHAQTLRALARKIEERQHLGLSTRWWLDQARDQLDIYDRRNPA